MPPPAARSSFHPSIKASVAEFRPQTPAPDEEERSDPLNDSRALSHGLRSSAPARPARRRSSMAVALDLTADAPAHVQTALPQAYGPSPARPG